MPKTIIRPPQSGRSRDRIGGRTPDPANVYPYLKALLPPLLLTALLSACETTAVVEPEPEPIPEPLPAVPVVPVNPDIVDAWKILAAARAANAEWLVLEPRVSELPVSLGEILHQAEQAQEEGDTALASELARKVSRMSRLGLEQAAGQSRAGPYYPQ